MGPLDGIDLLFGDSAAVATPVQDPVMRPPPVQRPGFDRPRPAAPRMQQPMPSAPPPQQQAAPLDGVDLLFGTPDAKPSAPAQAPADPMAEPDAKSWLGRRWQEIRGKQDPTTANLPQFLGPTMERELPDASARGPIAAHMVLGQDDDSLAKLIGEQLGPRFRGVRKDANGYPIVSYVGQDGNPAEAYVNRPGLDMQDLARGVASAVPYVAVGGAVNALGKGLSLVPRMVAQGTTQGLTAATTDLGAAVGGLSDFDPGQTAVKAGLAAGFGAGGEAVGALTGTLWRKFVTEPGLFDKSAGTLTPRGMQEAQAAGIDPATLSRDLQQQFAQQLARTGSRDIGARSVSSAEFGIPRTQGELLQDVPALIREQQVRGGNYGEAAAQRMKEFDTSQRESINNALFGEITRPTTGTTKPGIAQQIAPGRTGADYGKDSIGQAIKSNTDDAIAKAAEKEDFAWSFVPRDITPGDGALPLLKKRLNSELGSFPVPKGGAAEQMANDLQAFLDGKAPEKAANWISYDPQGQVEQVRKRLSAALSGAETKTDKTAAGAMYRAFNDWMDEAATQGLLNGANPFDVGKIKIAKGISHEIHQVFDGQKGTAGARILSDVIKKADSAEGVINALFTGPTSEIKGGTISALQSLKTAYDTHLAPEAAKSAWDDIRLAYFMRMVQNPKNLEAQAPGAQALQSSIANALNKQSSVVRALYTPEEIGMLRRFSAALQGIDRKNINSSWSGVSAASFARDFINATIQAFGFKSKMAGTVGNIAGASMAKHAYGSAAASEAISGQLKGLPSPSFAGYGGAYGSQQD